MLLGTFPGVQGVIAEDPKLKTMCPNSEEGSHTTPAGLAEG